MIRPIFVRSLRVDTHIIPEKYEKWNEKDFKKCEQLKLQFAGNTWH